MLITATACTSQAEARVELDYQQVISCTVAVKGYQLSLIKVGHSRNSAQDRESNADVSAESARWVEEAVAKGAAVGKTADQVLADLETERPKQGLNYAEWKRLGDLYTNSDPSLRLMPYYKPMPPAERQNILNRQKALADAADVEIETKYKHCSPLLR